MRRRDFVAIASAATVYAWSGAGQAQSRIIGFLSALSSNYIAQRTPAFRKGLAESGYPDMQNTAIEFRSAEGQYDRLPGLVADLIQRNVAVIVAAGGTDPAKVAKAATTSIPIVFISAADPLKAGIVESLNRPGGNVTGVSLLGTALEAKRLGLLREIIPGAALIGALVNPQYPDVDLQLRELQTAAEAINQKIVFLRASTDTQIDGAFASAIQQGAAALLIAQDALFVSRRDQLAALATRYKLPVIGNQREYAESGGLISYATDFADGYRQAGIYVGKILAGAKPADLPVLQSTKFELVINLKTAKALGLSIPPGVLAIADEVIE
jgi:putative tryptophan/tyrosine transport system substrate-binding protein